MALIRTNSGSGGGGSIWDNWPDLSDGETLTSYNDRISNLTANKAKKIGTDIYIEVAGDLSLTSSATGHEYFTVINAISLITNTSSAMDITYSITSVGTSSKSIRGFTVSYEKKIIITTYGSGTFTTPIKLKMILHNQ